MIDIKTGEARLIQNLRSETEPSIDYNAPLKPNEVLVYGTQRQISFISDAVKQKRRRDAKAAKKSRKKNRKKS